MLTKIHDKTGIDDAVTLDWRELAAKRLARLIESEQAHSELQHLVERLRQEHFQLLTTLHGRTLRVSELERQLETLEQQLGRQLESRDAELARLRPMWESRWGSAWRFAQQARKPSNWPALAKLIVKRLLKLIAGVRVLRLLIGKALRRTPGLRARLLAMIDLN
ncbi:hypothetical protein [Dyella acidisoli]|uniref:Uncharacterized protein n=1 Tax=Dyella acidisoli TaxID=1867834 RepID=A0ABQ5XP95_9GAMM|nr:hypothetical protein [Dyella acidisoli]GLQ93009.1 hypothetical protein GCM10007901_19600 [Dyella acidisoli]